MTDFVNPYNFVPLPERVHRTPPPRAQVASGELQAGDLLCGSIKVSWRLQAPLLLPAVARDEGWVGDDGTIRIPGSSLKGAVRATHEALFNGCLRVVDQEFVPGYRDSARARTGWRLAIVTQSRNGVPTQFQLCEDEEPVWIDAVELLRKWPKGQPLPGSGDIVDIVGPVVDTSLDRFEMREVKSVDVIDARGAMAEESRATDNPDVNPFRAEGLQVFLVTDVGARRETKRDGTIGRCLWASAVLSNTLVDFAPETDGVAWSEFVRASAGSEDRRILEQDTRATEWRSRQRFTTVRWRGRDIARRAMRSGFLFRGDVVWVSPDKSPAGGLRITGISLSSIWRHAGAGPVARRIGDHAPCLTRGGTDLCISCATFGAADTGGRGAGAAEQKSYASHVSFGAARSAPAATLATIHLTPMAAPKPASGGFYLELPQPRLARTRGDKPGEWGGSSDRDQTAPIRGRKFYWHSNPDGQAKSLAAQHHIPERPRYQATPHQVEKAKGMVRSAELVAAGTLLTATITFDEFTRPLLDALVAALDPRLLSDVAGYPGHRLGIHLGGGKPLGLGSAVVEEIVVRFCTARERYTGSGATHPAPEPLTPEQLDAIQGYAGVEFRAGLPTICRLLDLDGLGGEEGLVAYPPGGDWSRFDQQAFRESFEHFMATNGEQLRDSARPWQPLNKVTPAGTMRQQARRSSR